MSSSIDTRIKVAPKPAAQRKLGLFARICYVIGGIIALLWLFYFLFPYAGTKMDQASDYSRQLEDKVFLTDEEMQNFALKNFSLRKEEENHKVKKLEITNKSFAQLANEMRGFLAILRDWEKKHNKNFLTSHPTMKEISSKEILHSANGFEPKLFTFEDYPITSDVYSDPHYQYAHFNLINLYFQEFIGLNIANENFHYGDEEKPFMLHQGVCAVPSNENTKIVNAKYGRLNFIECGAVWRRFLIALGMAKTDSQFLALHPAHNLRKITDALADEMNRGTSGLNSEIKRQNKITLANRAAWLERKTAEIAREKQLFALEKEKGDNEFFRIFGYFLFFFSTIALFTVNKRYGFINLPNGLISPKKYKYTLWFLILMGFTFTFGVTNEMKESGVLWHDGAGTRDVIFLSLLVFFALLLFFPAFYGAIEYFKETEFYRKLFVYGKGASARWGSIKTYMKYDFSDFMKRAKYEGIGGELEAPIYCGRTTWRSDLMLGCRDIGLNSNSHMLTIALSGGGKSLYVIWNELLSWPGGAFIFDPKGEHTERTYIVRSEYAPFYVLDPSGAVNETIPHASLNPFAGIDINSDNAGADLRRIIQASFLDVGSTSANSEYFRAKAKELAMGYTVQLLTKYPKKYHNLPSMFNLTMMGTPDGVGIDEEAIRILHAEMAVNEAVGSAAMIAAKTLKDAGERGELGGIKNSFSEAFQWVLEPAITQTLMHSSFSMDEIRTKKATVSVCVTLDTLEDDNYIRWFRTMSAMAFSVTRIPLETRYKTLFLFDECAQLGHFRPIQKGLSTLRSKDVKMHLFFQDFGQIKGLYKNYSEFMSSCDKQIFSCRDNETAEEISKLLGRYLDKWNEGSEHSPRFNERERQLRPPSEIMGQLYKGGTEQYIIPLDGYPMELELIPFYKNFNRYGRVSNSQHG